MKLWSCSVVIVAPTFLANSLGLTYIIRLWTGFLNGIAYNSCKPKTAE